MISLQTAAFEGKGMVGALAGYPELGTRGAPLMTVRLDPPATAALVCNEVRELVLERSPNLIWLALVELGIELDAAVRPPSAARGGAHSRVPKNSHFASQFWQCEPSGCLGTPCRKPVIGIQRAAMRGRRRSKNSEPIRPAKLRFWQFAKH